MLGKVGNDTLCVYNVQLLELLYLWVLGKKKEIMEGISSSKQSTYLTSLESFSACGSANHLLEMTESPF